MTQEVCGWEPVAPLPEALTTETARALARVDQFQERWREFVASASSSEMNERRERNLRRHAIETGIIEHLYDVSWGVTEELVAEGITLDVAEREGELSEDTLATINAQLEALNLLVEYVHQNRELSSSFIRELHAAITATQRTYSARDQFGNPVEVAFQRGTWKTNENHVRRPDGSLLEYTPAIFVQDEIDTLVEQYKLYVEAEVHPVQLAAWLHHRFIRIHPFSDGNGRVARALTLLVLIQREFTPLVVRRETREEYIEALDRANDGDLEPLIRLFARLEEYAILAELEIRSSTAATTAVQVASEYAKRLKARLEFGDNARREGVVKLSSDLLSRIVATLEGTATELKDTFADVDSTFDAWVRHAAPPAAEAQYWRAEIVRAAKEVDFYTNLQGGTWWAALNVKISDIQMRYVAVLQKVGHGETGILALTYFADSFVRRAARHEDDSSAANNQVLIRLRPSDGLNFLHTDSANEAWTNVEDSINKTLTAALQRFLDSVG